MKTGEVRRSKHRLYYSRLRGNLAAPKLSGYSSAGTPKEETTPFEDLPDGISPNLISSLCESGLHAPVLDLDEQFTLLKPSASDGCYHLVMSAEMPWWKYRVLLWWMMRCGVIEKGFYRASRRRKMSMVRM